MNYRVIPSINPLLRLNEQMRRWRLYLMKTDRRLTIEKLAEEAGVEQGTLLRALGPGAELLSESLALRLAGPLGMDPAQVLLVHGRDRAREEEDRARKRDDPADQARFRQLREQLEAHLCWQPARPVEATWTRRLAFLAERKLRDCSVEDVARKAARISGGSWRELGRVVRLYEAGMAHIESSLIDLWLRALSEGKPALRQEEIDQRARALHDIHPLTTTLDWREYRGVASIPGVLAYCPKGPGYQLLFAHSPTLHQTLDIQMIRAYQPRRATRSLVRIVAGPHVGYEIGVVLEGQVRLTLSTQPLPAETLDQPATYTVGQQGVVHDALYSAGPEAVLAFPSGRFHHRVEFLSREALVLAINLRGNLLLGNSPPSRT